MMDSEFVVDRGKSKKKSTKKASKNSILGDESSQTDPQHDPNQQSITSNYLLRSKIAKSDEYAAATVLLSAATGGRSSGDGSQEETKEPQVDRGLVDLRTQDYTGSTISQLTDIQETSSYCCPLVSLNDESFDDSLAKNIESVEINTEAVDGPAAENSRVGPDFSGVRLDDVGSGSVSDSATADIKHPSSTYASIFKDKSNNLNKGKLRFIPPVLSEIGTKHASIPDELFVKLNDKWLLTLVGYFVGKRPAFPFVRFHAFRLWKQFGLVDVILNEQGYFYFKFNNDEGLQHVLKNRPWLFNDIPVLLKQWDLGIEQEKFRPITVSLWVNIYDLRSSMWDYEILSHIVSVIGVPIAIDRYTEEICEKKSGRARFARVLVKVNADEDIPSFVEAKVLGKMKKFRLQYYWKPDRCSHCNIFGHKFIDCTDKPISVEEKEARMANAVPVNVASPSGTDDQDIQVNQEFQQPKRRRRRPMKAVTTGASQIPMPKVQYIPKKSEKPEDPKDKANTTILETTVHSDPPLETAVPDTQSGIHAPVHQDIPNSPVTAVDATTLSPNPQPSFSRLNHVGTSKNAESDSDIIWNYKDPTGKIHGPFSLAQLQKWREMGCFPNDLKIWRTSSTKNESLLLLYVLQRRATVNCTTNGPGFQNSRGTLKNSDGG